MVFQVATSNQELQEVFEQLTHATNAEQKADSRIEDLGNSFKAKQAELR